MAKIISLSIGVNVATDSPEIGVLLDNGTEAVLKAGDDFISVNEHVTALGDVTDPLRDMVASLQAEIGALQQEIANRSDAPKPLLHEEHQDVPVPRTLDKLATLDQLKPHEALDEPQPPRLEDDPDAPARPPLGAHRGLDEALADLQRKAAEQNTETTG